MGSKETLLQIQQLMISYSDGAITLDQFNDSCTLALLEWAKKPLITEEFHQR